MTKINKSTHISKKTRPAMSPEARENQLVSMAYDLVEERIKNGTATAQEVTHFLKLGTQKSKYELEKLRSDIDLQQAKKKSLESADVMKELYSNALKVFATYTGDDYYEDDEE
jgi:hypothetical protein